MSRQDWRTEARQGFDGEYEMDQDLIDELKIKIFLTLQEAGKAKSFTLNELSGIIGYRIEDSPDLMDYISNEPLIDYDHPNIRYKPEINADTEDEFLISLREHPDGIKRLVVTNACNSADTYLPALVQQGKIIATRDDRSSDVYSYYRRDRRYMTKLSGTAKITPGLNYIEMTRDVSREVRQGDALLIVNSNPKASPYSVASLKSIDEAIDKHESKRSWNYTISKRVYLDRKLDEKEEQDATIYRFGVTNDIRTLWLNNCQSFYKNKNDLARKIEEAHLSYKSILVTQVSQIKRSRKANT